MDREYKRVVVCAANLVEGTIVCGVRHWDGIMCDVVDIKGLNDIEHIQGFVDNYGNFLTRKEAYLVAKEAGQLGPEHMGYEDSLLFSEDLY